MLLLDDDNKDIAREYEITFNAEDSQYAVKQLKELLKHPIIVSEEIKKGIATDLLEPLTVFEKSRDEKIIEVRTEDIKNISEYVTIANVIKLVKKYNFPFTIGFISTHLSYIEEVIKELDYVSAKYLNQLLENYSAWHFEKLCLLLYSYCSVKYYEEMSRFVLSNPEKISTIPEAQLFKDIFFHVTLTETVKPYGIAPFSIPNLDANSCRYDEVDREVIEGSITTARSNDLIYESLCLRPSKKININPTTNIKYI